MLKLKGHKDSVNCLDCRADCLLASGSDDCTVRLWDLRNDQSVDVLRGMFNNEPVNSVCFSSKHAHMLYTAAGSSVLGFDMRKTGSEESVSGPCEQYACNTEEINQIAVHPKKGNMLAACDDDGDIQIIDLEQKKPLRTLSNQHENICTTVAFRPNAVGDLISGALDATVVVWDVQRGRPLQRIEQDNELQKQGLRSQDDESLAYRGGAAAGTGKQPMDSRCSSTPPPVARTQVCNPPFVYSLAFTPSGRHFVAGLGDGSVAAYEFRTRRMLYALDGHRALVNQVHFPGAEFVQECSLCGEDRSTLLTAGNDRQIILWQLSFEEAKVIKSNRCTQATSKSKAKKKGKGKKKGKQDLAASEAASPSSEQQLAAPPPTVASVTAGMGVGGRDGAEAEAAAEASAEASGPGGQIVWSVEHKRNANWISSAFTSAPIVMVADPGKDITIYNVV